MPDALVEQASVARLERDEEEQLDLAISTLLARYEAVTQNKRSMGYLRFLLRYYGRKTHPFTECVKDNAKRFGPKTKGLCGVVKDTIRQGTHWRHGPPRGPHPGHPDSGTPGVDIGFRDAPYAPAWGGHHNLRLEEAKEQFADVAEEVWAALLDLSEQCDPCRVLLGLDPAPSPSATFLSEYVGVAA